MPSLTFLDTLDACVFPEPFFPEFFWVTAFVFASFEWVCDFLGGLRGISSESSSEDWVVASVTSAWTLPWTGLFWAFLFLLGTLEPFPERRLLSDCSSQEETRDSLSEVLRLAVALFIFPLVIVPSSESASDISTFLKLFDFLPWDRKTRFGGEGICGSVDCSTFLPSKVTRSVAGCFLFWLLWASSSNTEAADVFFFEVLALFGKWLLLTAVSAVFLGLPLPTDSVFFFWVPRRTLLWSDLLSSSFISSASLRTSEFCFFPGDFFGE